MKLHITTAFAALFAASPALAFDTINWNWDADVQTNVAVTANATVDVAPTGLEQVEGDQVMSGNLSATGTTTGVDNVLSGLTPSLDDVLAVETQASGIGNNASLESDVAVNYDLNQDFGGVAVSVVDPLTGATISTPVPGIIVASADTSGIVNGTVDNDATGVANNISVDLQAGSSGDSFLVGNSVQTAMADVTTTSTVGAISFSGVSGLGTLESPAVSSVATSVGNNLDVSVGAAMPYVVPVP